MDSDFFVFAAVGFAAQLVDGALGMAYGVVSTTSLLAMGVSPANASASVHAAKVFTGAASALSHVVHKNIGWKLLGLLSAGGIVGGVIGTYVLTSIDGRWTTSVADTYAAAARVEPGTEIEVQIRVGVRVDLEVLAAEQDRCPEEHPSDDQRDQVRVDQQLESPDGSLARGRLPLPAALPHGTQPVASIGHSGIRRPGLRA